MKLDYGTIVINERERRLLPLLINSFRHYNSDLEINFKVSLLPEDTETADLCRQLSAEVIHLPIYKQRLNGVHANQGSFDCANRLCDLMDRSSAPWVALSHSDIIYKGSIDQTIRSAGEDVGAIGSWPLGLLIVNREIYNVCHFGFWQAPPLWVMEHHQGNLVMRGRFDEPKQRLVEGVDVGVLLKLEIQGYGYKCIFPSIETIFHHIGEQSGHCLDGIRDDVAKEQRRLNMEEKNKAALKRFKHFA